LPSAGVAGKFYLSTILTYYKLYPIHMKGYTMKKRELRNLLELYLEQYPAPIGTTKAQSDWLAKQRQKSEAKAKKGAPKA
jgi:hypothetical protein